MLYSSIRLVRARLAKFHQLPTAVMLLAVLVLSGCKSTPESGSPTASTTEKSAETKPATTPSKSETAPAAATGKIDVNSASIAELDKLELPGTKPSLSERIQGKRPYQSADDLVSKKAISADELKLIRDLIVVGKAK
jgi:DNA uptake protein ComE-like DNA-binding protein